MKNENKFKIVLSYIINFILIGFILVCIFYKPNVSVEAPGGLINIGDRLSNVKYESEGSFNLTYVSSYHGSFVMMLLGYVLPDWEVVKDSDTSDIDYNSLVKMQTISLYSSISNAIYNAYNNAGVDANITNYNFYVYYIYEESDTSLELGDKILSYDDNTLEDSLEFKKYILSKNTGDIINFKVLRDDKETDAYAKVIEENDTKLIGIVIDTIFDYENDPDIHYMYKESELGSSGGLMLSLSIYNALVEEDITKGLTISGTGTIDLEGNVGGISGIKYKILGASKNKADVFIVPEENYEEALNIINERNIKIKLIKAKTINQVLEDIKNL